MESKVLPATSQATPGAFMKEYEKAKEAGEAAVVITIASKLSGTYQSALIAAEEYDNIYVVESGNAAIGSGVLVEIALRLLDEGKTAEEIAQILEEEKKKIVLIALVDTLEYLKRSGRISKLIAMTGSILDIKPILSLDRGEINILAKARGSKMGNRLLTEEIENTGGVDFTRPVLFGFTGTGDELLQKYINHSRHIWEKLHDKFASTTVGSAIGTHVGPGAVAVAFFRKASI